MNNSMEPITLNETTEPNQVRSSVITYSIGAFLGFLSTLVFYVAFSEGIFSDDFLTFLLWAIILGLCSFLCFSPWKRTNFLISGVMLLGAGAWMLIGLFDYRYDDFWSVLIWTIVFLLIGLSLLLRFFNTTLFQSIKRMVQTKIIRLIAKIVFWGGAILIGLLVLAGIFSWVAGLSATTIIIVLLILIWLK